MCSGTNEGFLQKSLELVWLFCADSRKEVCVRTTALLHAPAELGYYICLLMSLKRLLLQDGTARLGACSVTCAAGRLRGSLSGSKIHIQFRGPILVFKVTSLKHSYKTKTDPQKHKTQWLTPFGSKCVFPWPFHVCLTDYSRMYHTYITFISHIQLTYHVQIRAMIRHGSCSPLISLRGSFVIQL